MSTGEQQKTKIGTAHGKVILFGEHAVVYGIPAIAVGIDRGARATLTPSDATTTTMTTTTNILRVREWNMTVREDDSETPLARAFADLVRLTREAGVNDLPERFTIEAEADLPPGGGLGCSAALGVAVARALDGAAPGEVIAKRVNDAWESVFHGNPSGIDTAVSALGGCMQFVRAGGSFSIDRVKVPGVVHVCVGNSGQASSTRSMVEAVARLKDRRPETTQKTFDAIHTLVKNARLAIEAGDRNAVGQLLDLNQMLLSGLFVSTPEIETMVAAARSAGAFGSKLTGAGGGGCVIALVDTPEIGARVLTAWKKEGFDGFITTFRTSERRNVTAAAAPHMEAEGSAAP
jgi:mevalonate kinase